MKKTPIQKIKAKLDKVWSLAVRRKYPRCIVCGKEPTQAHHAIVRRAQSLGVRWMVSNGVGLCYVCHIHKLHGNQGDKLFLDRYMALLNDLIPDDEQQNIIDIGHRVNKYSIGELEDMLRKIQDEYLT
jgi:hypothetical protein